MLHILSGLFSEHEGQLNTIRNRRSAARMRGQNHHSVCLHSIEFQFIFICISSVTIKTGLLALYRPSTWPPTSNTSKEKLPFNNTRVRSLATLTIRLWRLLGILSLAQFMYSWENRIIYGNMSCSSQPCGQRGVMTQRKHCRACARSSKWIKTNSFSVFMSYCPTNIGVISVSDTQIIWWEINFPLLVCVLIGVNRCNNEHLNCTVNNAYIIVQNDQSNTITHLPVLKCRRVTCLLYRCFYGGNIDQPVRGPH